MVIGSEEAEYWAVDPYSHENKDVLQHRQCFKLGGKKKLEKTQNISQHFVSQKKP